MDQLQRSIDARQRRNVALLEEQSQRLFARLYHEAFHAYLENFVYPREDYDVPRWLNEGLAEVFEAGIVEGENLRVDAPLREALTRLKTDLRASPLPLEQVFSADHRAFLVAHDDSGAASARHYAYAWGLAYYLCFEKHILGSAELDRYVSRESTALAPARRFERLVGEPLGKFERRWRSYMLQLK